MNSYFNILVKIKSATAQNNRQQVSIKVGWNKLVWLIYKWTQGLHDLETCLTVLQARWTTLQLLLMALYIYTKDNRMHTSARTFNSALFIGTHQDDWSADTRTRDERINANYIFALTLVVRCKAPLWILCSISQCHGRCAAAVSQVIPFALNKPPKFYVLFETCTNPRPWFRWEACSCIVCSVITSVLATGAFLSLMYALFTLEESMP